MNTLRIPYNRFHTFYNQQVQQNEMPYNRHEVRAISDHSGLEIEVDSNIINGSKQVSASKYLHVYVSSLQTYFTFIN